MAKPGDTSMTDSGVRFVGTLDLASEMPATPLSVETLFSFGETFFDEES